MFHAECFAPIICDPSQSITSSVYSLRRVNGAKDSLIALNIETLCFREKKKLDVFDFTDCCVVSITIIYAPVNQICLWQVCCCLLSLMHLYLKLRVTLENLN